MLFSPTLRLEALEGRLAPSSLSDTTHASTNPYVDPTLNPSTPGNTYSALITAVGGDNGQGGYSITVTGLDANALQNAGTISVQVGNVTTTVSSYTVNPGGSVTLTLTMVNGLTDAVANATTIGVTAGNPATPPAPPASPPPSHGYDPTLHAG